MLLWLQQPLEGTIIDRSHALIGTSLSTICACLRVLDCVEQSLLFVPLAVKWTAQCDFMAVKEEKNSIFLEGERILVKFKFIPN